MCYRFVFRIFVVRKERENAEKKNGGGGRDSEMKYGKRKTRALPKLIPLRTELFFSSSSSTTAIYTLAN